MGKKAATPAAPNYTALAEQTAAANRPTQNTALGTSAWSKDASGNPVQTQTLNPADQARLDQQRQIQSGLLGQAQNSMANPLDTSGMTAMNPNQLDPGFGAVQQVKDDYLKLMQPQQDQQHSQLAAMLKERGIPMNSAAWANAMRAQGDSDARRGWEATDKATSAYNDIFNRGLAGNTQANASRNQQMREATALRQMPMDEYQQYGGNVTGQLPMPGFQPGPNYGAAGEAQYQAAVAAANAKNASNPWNSVMKLGGTLLGSMAGPMGASLGGQLGGMLGGAVTGANAPMSSGWGDTFMYGRG
jgi:hypothetical protein